MLKSNDYCSPAPAAEAMAGLDNLYVPPLPLLQLKRSTYVSRYEELDTGLHNLSVSPSPVDRILVLGP
jgi:hypothetical protein